MFKCVKDSEPSIKNTIAKSEIANTLYELLIKKEEV